MVCGREPSRPQSQMDDEAARLIDQVRDRTLLHVASGTLGWTLTDPHAETWLEVEDRVVDALHWASGRWNTHVALEGGVQRRSP